MPPGAAPSSPYDHFASLVECFEYLQEQFKQASALEEREVLLEQIQSVIAEAEGVVQQSSRASSQHLNELIDRLPKNSRLVRLNFPPANGSLNP